MKRALKAVLVAAVLISVFVVVTSNVLAAAPEHSVTWDTLDGATIYIGEILNVTPPSLPPGVTVSSITVSFEEVAEPYQSFTITGTNYAKKEITRADVPEGCEGKYNFTITATTNVASVTRTGEVYIQEPTLALKVKDERGVKEISSTTKGKNITLVADTNLPDDFNVKLKRKDPDGHVHEVNYTLGALKGGISVLVNWKVGEHELWLEPIQERCWDITKDEAPCEHVAFTVYKEEITISAEKTETTKQEKVKITVTAPPYTPFNVTVTHPEDVIMTDAGDNPLNLAPGTETNLTGKVPFAATTDENGVCEFVVYFTDERTYTFKVWYDAPSYDAAPEVKKDDIDIDVREIEVTIEVPETAVIGDKVEIRGTVSAGTDVDIVIDDILEFNDEPLSDGTFEVDWDTSGKTTGSYTIEVYVDCDVVGDADLGKDVSDILDEAGVDPDGTATIRLVEPTVTAELPRDEVAKGDEIVIQGTAYGVDEVDIVIVGPDGCEDVANYETSAGITAGLYFTTATVSDNEFKEDIDIPEDADSGVYLIAVLTPGRDGVYGESGYEDGELLAYLIDYYVDMNGNGIPETSEIETRLVGKDADQLIDILGDLTFDKAGSDDLVAGPLTFRVASPYVEIEEIASVPVGEPLVINGTSNREDGTIITVTVKAGPAYEKIPSATTEVKDGKWSVTLDTSDAEPGIYTVEAEDEDGNVDEATFELLPAAAVTPTPSPTPPVEVTPTPSPTPPVEVTPTPSPTPPAATPSPTPPGFTAVFTIAGILAVAYLIIRRRK
ncbi:MAG: hypothetical protein OD814_001110 [Candidatus Alkanophagales archaeon MCA70_species_1]|nr:hypothetical protein [Candidatus Alkanophaga volatiphilum]